MNQVNRRQSLKLFLGGLLQAAGTVVLASVALPARAAQQTSEEAAKKTQQDVQKDLAQRADRVAEAHGPLAEGEGVQPCAFINGGFRNGGFRNGGGGGGGFRNGGFANGSFRNGGFANGGFRNGGFANGVFRNF